MYEAGGSGQTPSSPPPPGNMFPTLNNEIPLQQLPEEKYEDIGSWNTHGKNWSVDSSTGLQRCQRYFAKIYNNCAHLRIKKNYTMLMLNVYLNLNMIGQSTGNGDTCPQC